MNVLFLDINSSRDHCRHLRRSSVLAVCLPHLRGSFVVNAATLVSEAVPTSRDTAHATSRQCQRDQAPRNLIPDN